MTNDLLADGFSSCINTIWQIMQNLVGKWKFEPAEMLNERYYQVWMRNDEFKC